MRLLSNTSSVPRPGRAATVLALALLLALAGSTALAADPQQRAFGDVPLQIADGDVRLLPGYQACAVITRKGDATDEPPDNASRNRSRPPADLQLAEIHRLIQAEPERCQATFNDSPSFGVPDAPVWLRFRLQNLDGASDWYLQVMPNVDTIDFYQLKPGGDLLEIVRQARAGRRVPYAEYPVPHRNHLFPIELAQGQAATIYLRLESAGPLWAGISLITRTHFLQIEQREQFLFGAYFSALFVIALLSLFFLVAARSFVYVAYLGYLLTFSFLIFTLHGYSYQILWPASPDWNVRSVLTIALLTIICALQFTRAFLEYSPRSWFNRVINWLCIILLALAALNFWRDSAALWFVALPVSATGVLMVFGGGIQRMWQGFRPAIFFFAGWSMMAILMIEEALALVGIISFEYVNHYQVLAASALEMLFFMMALAHRYYLLLQEKDLAERTLQRDRDRMAHEIHDSLGAELTSLIVQLESPGTSQDGQALRRDFGRRLRTTLEKLRDIMHLTRGAPARSENTVASEIEDFAQRLSATGQYEIELELEPAAGQNLDARSALHIVRIYQEWMTNIVRHTPARTLRIRWQQARDGALWLKIGHSPAADFRFRYPPGQSGAQTQNPAAIDPARTDGVGQSSLRWRLGELRAQARSLQNAGGLSFAARFPLPDRAQRTEYDSMPAQEHEL